MTYYFPYETCGQYKKVTTNTAGRFSSYWAGMILSRKKMRAMKTARRHARHERMAHGKHHKGKGLR